MLLGRHRLGEVRADRRVLLRVRLAAGRIHGDALLLQRLQVGAGGEQPVRQHGLQLRLELLLDVLHGLHQMLFFVGAGDHVGRDDQPALDIHARQRRVVGREAAFLVGSDPRLGIGQRNPLRQRLVGLLQAIQLGHRAFDLGRPPLGVLKSGGQLFPARLVGVFQSGLPLEGGELVRQFRLDLPQLFRREAAVPVVVGLDPRAVKRQPLQRRKQRLLRHQADLHEQLREGGGVLAAELAERGVIDRSRFHQPAKVDPLLKRRFQLAAGANLHQQPVQNDARQHPRMNRRLPVRHVFVCRLPRRPVQLPQHLIQKPHRMIGPHRIVQPLRKQHRLPPIQPRPRPPHRAPSCSLPGPPHSAPPM